MAAKHLRGLRCKTVERSCTHAIVKVKSRGKWHDGDWFFFHFTAIGSGNYQVKEVIKEHRQWQVTFSQGCTIFPPGSWEWNAARKHALRAIETARKNFGDQGEMF